ncbi:MAG: polyprenyl synthetase family protein [Lactobacillus sp.]|jgi:farnesyl diphosphate synthase|nr:polyprenyl synthetase family protein [Lactobacillus sp.]
MSDIKKVISAYSDRFNQEISKHFPMPEGKEKRVVEAMHYSLSNGGKRMRPFLVSETSSLFGLPLEKSLNTALALECVHTYSLIHDDLPCMDNDDLRRGKPTCHKQFDEATAVLAGDGLLTYAFELLSKEEKCAELVKLFSSAAGAFDGMIAGQMLDIISEETAADEATIKRIEEMKTGRLIRYACEAGAVLGNAAETEKNALINYSRKIGMAFQIADDILDVEGNPELMGKTLGKDKEQGKITFVGLYGLEKSKEIAHKLVDDAKKSLAIFGDKAINLKLLADYMIERNN